MVDQHNRRGQKMTPAKQRRIRVTGALAVLGCAAVLALAVWVKPDPRGYGSHTQITPGPCVFHWFTGLPCPTCGMTTSFAYMVRLQVKEAALAQPFGVILFAVVIVLMPVGLYCVATGGLPRLLARPSWMVAPALACLIAGWVFKIIEEQLVR